MENMPIQAGIDDPVTDQKQAVTSDLDGCLEVIASATTPGGWNERYTARNGLVIESVFHIIGIANM